MPKPSEFVPPGPGVWERESVHLCRPLSRSLAEIFPDAATAGFRWSMERYGLMLDTMEFKAVQRFIYICMRGVGAPKNAKGPPPKLIFKLLTKLHPEARRRIRDVRVVWATKRWREDVQRWDSEWKPAIIAENTALQRTNLSSMSDEQLASHLDQCFDNAARSIFRHHSLNATNLLPLGDFLAHVQEWTGRKPGEVLSLLRGSSRVSRGAAEELEALAVTLRAHPDAQTLLASTDPQLVLDALCARTDAVGLAARRYIDAAGVRIATGYDFSDLTLAEMPQLLVENIRSAITGSSEVADSEVAQREASLRERVPAHHRQQFDDLLAEARYTYRIRDERGYLNDAWAFGIARRSILAAGKRLASKGKLHDFAHAVELTHTELASMLRGGNDRTADQAAADAKYRETLTIHDAPQFLSGTPSGPPPAEWFPPHTARAERAIGIVIGEMFAIRENQKASSIVNGYAASAGQIVGTARLVLKPQDMGRVRKGDVLVTRSTSPSYNELLPLLSAVVTDRGGTLSHAAIVAREYGIPAVVGCGNATELIADGMRVRVDGALGTVELLK